MGPETLDDQVALVTGGSRGIGHGRRSRFTRRRA
jgi:NAD(P)-dependent dehydrogenase (short-subunit alcohol dehydrogenase family)